MPDGWESVAYADWPQEAQVLNRDAHHQPGDGCYPHCEQPKERWELAGMVRDALQRWVDAEAECDRLREALKAAALALEYYAEREDAEYDLEAQLAVEDGTGNPGLVVRRAGISLLIVRDALRLDRNADSTPESRHE